jgi:hypothetical protein
MTELEANLRWTCEALILLNANGFPCARETQRILNSRGLSPKEWEKELTKMASNIIEVTKHISHPALTALKESLDKNK